MNGVERYDSPVLLHLEGIGERVPSERVACTTCPVALWYWPGNDALVCFCSALHRETWKAEWNIRADLPAESIKFCDGREQALARLAERAQAS